MGVVWIVAGRFFFAAIFEYIGPAWSDWLTTSLSTETHCINSSHPPRHNPGSHALAIQAGYRHEKVPFAHDVIKGRFIHLPVVSSDQRRSCKVHLCIGKA